MDMCLLCLALTKNSENAIKVQSLQWQEWKIEQIIEKHIFPLKYLTSTSWICKSCWQVIRDFHKLYTHIQNAHAFFNSTLVKTEMQEIPEDEYIYVNETNLQREGEHHMEVEMDQFLDNTISNEKTKQPPEVKLKPDNADTILTQEVTLPSKTSSMRGEDPIQEALLDNIRSITIQNNVSHKQKRKMAKKMKTTSKKKTGNRYTNKPIETTAAEDSETDSSSDNQQDEDDNLHSDDVTSALNKHREKDMFVSENFKIICGICLLPMQTFGIMSTHSLKEHNQRGFVTCCTKKFYTRIHLIDHLRWHYDPEHFKCKQCGKLLGDRRCLKVHVRRLHEQLDRNHICDICGKGFARPVNLQRHKYTHIPDEERKMPCNQCDKKFANNVLLMEHVRSVHLRSYSVVCDICGKEIRSKAVFKRHMLQHSDLQTAVRCGICGLKLNNKRNLKCHKRAQHSGEAGRQYKCHICSKICANRRSLKRHVQYNHEMGYDFKCTECDKAFKLAYELKQHMAALHTGAALFTCTYCPKTFSHSSNMYTHRRKVHCHKTIREKYSGNLPPTLQKPSVATGLEQNGDETK